MATDQDKLAGFPGSRKRTASDLHECDPHLKLLYQEHQWFELRDAVATDGQQMLYRGAVACAFNQFPQWQAQLALLITSAPQSREAYEAHNLLSWMHLRNGNFPQARSHIEAMLAWGMDEGVTKVIHGLLSIIAQFPQQLTLEHRHCNVPYKIVEGNMFVPVVVNGKSANFMIDSGATISMIRMTEAERLGLSIKTVDPCIGALYGATGTPIECQTAVAAQINVGGVQLANVAFLVLKDHQFQFPDAYGGALGLPVLLAFQTLSWSADGLFQIGSPSRQRCSTKANICFDGAEPVTEVVFQRRKLSFVLDTGSGNTVLWSAFGRQFRKLVDRRGQVRSIMVNGVSGSAKLDAIRLPGLTLRVGGHDIVLRGAHLLRQPTTPNSGWLFGRLGMDALNSAYRVTLDFKRMSLRLAHCDETQRALRQDVKRKRDN